MFTDRKRFYWFLDNKFQIFLRYQARNILDNIGLCASCVGWCNNEHVLVAVHCLQAVVIHNIQTNTLAVIRSVILCWIYASTGGVRGTMETRWTAWLLVNRSSDRSCTRGKILSKIHLISPGCPRPSIALQMQNRGLKHHISIINGVKLTKEKISDFGICICGQFILDRIYK